MAVGQRISGTINVSRRPGALRQPPLEVTMIQELHHKATGYLITKPEVRGDNSKLWLWG